MYFLVVVARRSGANIVTSAFTLLIILTSCWNWNGKVPNFAADGQEQGQELLALDGQQPYGTMNVSVAPLAMATTTTAILAQPLAPLDCFYCRHSNRERDIIDRLDQHPECLSYELFTNLSQFRRSCTMSEPFCMTTVTSLNGFFADMHRDCVERCRPGCEESGYGIFVRKCTRCCQSPLCNHFDGKKFLLNDLDVQQLAGGMAAAAASNGTASQNPLPILDEAVMIDSGTPEAALDVAKNLMTVSALFTIAIFLC